MSDHKEKIKIAVLVSGGGTNLQALLDAEAAGRLPSGQIVLVVSSRPDAYALVRAQAAGVETLVADRRALGSGAAFERVILDALSAHDIELVVLAGFLSILSKEFIAAYPDRILNVHPSLIPAFCGQGYYGLAVHRAVLERGVKVTGATVHLVNEIPDGGRILAQKAVKVLDTDTPKSLQKRVMRLAEHQLLPAAVEAVAAALLSAPSSRGGSLSSSENPELSERL